MQTRTSSRRAASSAPAPAPAAAAVHQNYEEVSFGNLELLIRLRGVPGGCGRNQGKSDLIERLRKEALTPEGAKMAVEFPASRFDNDTGTTVSDTRTSGAHAGNTFFRGLLELRGLQEIEEWPAGSFRHFRGENSNPVRFFIPMALPTQTRRDCAHIRSDLSRDLGRPVAWHDVRDHIADSGVHLVDWLEQESDGFSRIVLPLAEALLGKIEALAEPVVLETKDVACGGCGKCQLFAGTFGQPHTGTLCITANSVNPPIKWKRKKKTDPGFKVTFQCETPSQERLSDDTIHDLKFIAFCKDVALLCRNFLVEVVAALDDTKLQEYAEAATELKHSHQYLGNYVRDAATYAKSVAARKKADRSRGWWIVKHSEINDNTIPMRTARDAEGVFEPTSDDLLAWGKR